MGLTSIDLKVDKILKFLTTNKNHIDILLTDSSYIYLLDVDEEVKKRMLITYDMVKGVIPKLIIKNIINDRYLITLQITSISFNTEYSKNVSLDSIKVTLHNLLKAKVLTFNEF